MASIKDQELRITQEGSSATVTVTYKAMFSPLDRQMASQGLRFRENIVLQGMDGSNATNLTWLEHFYFSLTAGTGDLTIPRESKKTISRSVLQEDVAAGDADEIRAMIHITPVGLPEPKQAFTEVKTVLG